ncbi:MAG: hypothetical protein ACOCZ4_00395 [Bacteroidota bacterium]
MKASDLNMLAQLIISGLDLWHTSQTRNLELAEKTKEELIERLQKSTSVLKQLPDLEEK